LTARPLPDSQGPGPHPRRCFFSGKHSVSGRGSCGEAGAARAFPYPEGMSGTRFADEDTRPQAPGTQGPSRGAASRLAFEDDGHHHTARCRGQSFPSPKRTRRICHFRKHSRALPPSVNPKNGFTFFGSEHRPPSFPRQPGVEGDRGRFSPGRLSTMGVAAGSFPFRVGKCSSASMPRIENHRQPASDRQGGCRMTVTFRFLSVIESPEATR
jgi:hypothetical protein